MPDTLDKPAAPHPAGSSAPVLRSGTRVAVAVAVIVTVVVGGYLTYHHHAVQKTEGAKRLDHIQNVRVGVIAKAAGQLFYAPQAWGAHEYPGGGRADRIAARGEFRGAEMALWRVSAEEIAASKTPTASVESPENLCKISPAERALYRKDGVNLSRMRCVPIPGHHGTIRVGPVAKAVRLSVEMPDGDYLSMWADDNKNTIAANPAAWATDFVEHLAPYDLTGYSAEDLDRANAEFRY